MAGRAWSWLCVGVHVGEWLGGRGVDGCDNSSEVAVDAWLFGPSYGRVLWYLRCCMLWRSRSCRVVGARQTVTTIGDECSGGVLGLVGGGGLVGSAVLGVRRLS